MNATRAVGLPGGTRYCPDCGTPMDVYDFMRDVWHCPHHRPLWVTAEQAYYTVRALDLSRP